VVALTIIFSIQRCDPAPFYLFDEVDAALDPMYRGAVAQMISKQKQEKDGDPNSGCQFLTSSFHEELVKAADMHWLVSHSGMSRINRGTVNDQLTIVRKNALTATAAGGAAQ
jgi:structural maintenance of chromosome 3 (chondroitin sulfate proteoglycan 6)